MSLLHLSRQGTRRAVWLLVSISLALLGACGGGGGGGSTPAATLQSVTVTPAGPQVAAGSTAQLAATGNYSDGSHQTLTGQVTWTSSSTAVATVTASGLATGVATGTATITAMMQGISGSTQLTVTPAALTSIQVTPANPSLATNGTLQLTATGVFSDKSQQDL